MERRIFRVVRSMWNLWMKRSLLMRRPDQESNDYGTPGAFEPEEGNTACRTNAHLGEQESRIICFTRSRCAAAPGCLGG